MARDLHAARGGLNRFDFGARPGRREATNPVSVFS